MLPVSRNNQIAFTSKLRYIYALQQLSRKNSIEAFSIRLFIRLRMEDQGEMVFYLE